MDDAALAHILERLGPDARGELRQLVSGDQRESDAASDRLHREGTPEATALADLVDLLSVHDGLRRRVARVLEKMEVGA